MAEQDSARRLRLDPGLTDGLLLLQGTARKRWLWHWLESEFSFPAGANPVWSRVVAGLRGERSLRNLLVSATFLACCSREDVPFNMVQLGEELDALASDLLASHEITTWDQAAHVILRRALRRGDELLGRRALDRYAAAERRAVERRLSMSPVELRGRLTASAAEVSSGRVGSLLRGVHVISSVGSVPVDAASRIIATLDEVGYVDRCLTSAAVEVFRNASGRTETGLSLSIDIGPTVRGRGRTARREVRVGSTLHFAPESYLRTLREVLCGEKPNEKVKSRMRKWLEDHHVTTDLRNLSVRGLPYLQ
jgi:hypothetical protein